MADSAADAVLPALNLVLLSCLFNVRLGSPGSRHEAAAAASLIALIAKRGRFDEERLLARDGRLSGFTSLSTFVPWRS